MGIFTWLKGNSIDAAAKAKQITSYMKKNPHSFNREKLRKMYALIKATMDNTKSENVKKLILLCAIVFSLPACSGAETLNETCERRLASRANLSAEQSKKFCTCFIEESSKKYSKEKLASEMESGSSSAFKETLKDEFALCKAQIR